VFQCFDAQCGKKGDVIDLWASVTGLSLRDAAFDLIHTFGLESAPAHGTEEEERLGTVDVVNFAGPQDGSRPWCALCMLLNPAPFRHHGNGA
jgi:hypothetical protein